MDLSTELPLCDSEPIHIPGSIQPHGLMLVAARDGLMVWQAAGEVENWLGVADWQGAPLAALLSPPLVARLTDFVAADGRGEALAHVGYIGQLRSATGAIMDASAFLAGLAGAGPDARDAVVIELEPAADAPLSAALVLDRLDEFATTFQRAADMDGLCRAAATAFRRFTGFDRVLIYKFGDDGAGRVLAEDLRVGMRSFLDHRFPASDIPRQARALYLRNLVRVIPDINYTASPLRPPAPGAPLDLTDSALRSVSPIHLRYMFNMGMRASASFSIIKDGVLWGLVACHHPSPLRIPYEIRVACRTLAATLSREVKAREEAASYRERLRLRAIEDRLAALLSDSAAPSPHLAEAQTAMGADGIAVLRDGTLTMAGLAPPPDGVQALAAWLRTHADPVYATDRLAEDYDPAQAFAAAASGLLSMSMPVEQASATQDWQVLWFRAEQIDVVNWAGNPHKDQSRGAEEILTPRASFDDWIETVRGRARDWSVPQIDTARRLRTLLRPTPMTIDPRPAA